MTETHSIRRFAADEVGIVTVSTHFLRLSGDQWKDQLPQNRPNVIVNAQADIAAALALPLDRIVVNDVEPGSLIVYFTVTRNASQFITDASIDSLLLSSAFPSLQQQYQSLIGDDSVLLTGLSSGVIAQQMPPATLCSERCIITVVCVGCCFMTALFFGIYCWKCRPPPSPQKKRNVGTSRSSNRTLNNMTVTPWYRVSAANEPICGQSIGDDGAHQPPQEVDIENPPEASADMSPEHQGGTKQQHEADYREEAVISSAKDPPSSRRDVTSHDASIEIPPLFLGSSRARQSSASAVSVATPVATARTAGAGSRGSPPPVIRSWPLPADMVSITPVSTARRPSSHSPSFRSPGGRALPSSARGDSHPLVMTSRSTASRFDPRRTLESHRSIRAPSDARNDDDDDEIAVVTVAARDDREVDPVVTVDDVVSEGESSQFSSRRNAGGVSFRIRRI